MESVITLLLRGNPSTTLLELRKSTKLAHAKIVVMMRVKIKGKHNLFSHTDLQGHEN